MDGREVDFVIVEDQRPATFVECKLRDRDVDRGLRYLKQRFPEAQALQIALAGERRSLTAEGIRVVPAIEYLQRLV